MKAPIVSIPTDVPAAAQGALLRDLCAAVKRGELFLDYQPKLDLKAACVTGVEALVRWRHPRHGVLAPGQFIPLAERAGIVTELDAWVIDEACRQAGEWQRRQAFAGTMAVNVSALELGRPHFVEIVRDALQRHGADPDRLILEITESSAIGDLDAAGACVRELGRCGVRVSLDDFGTGHASLVNLKRLLVSEIKVDRAFISGIDCNAGDAAIVSAIIGMARAVGVTVVAEGVETVGQLTALARMGCDVAQGNLVGPPMAPAQLARKLAEYDGGGS